MGIERIIVTATWDAEAGVWTAASEDVIGMAAGADTVENLLAVLDALVPDLVRANGLPGEGVQERDMPIYVMVRTPNPVHVARA